MATDFFVLVTKLLKIDELTRFLDLQVLRSAVHLEIVARHQIKDAASGLNIRPDQLHFESGWRQPLAQMLRVCPDFEHQILGRIKAPRNNEFFFSRGPFLEVLGETVPS